MKTTSALVPASAPQSLPKAEDVSAMPSELDDYEWREGKQRWEEYLRGQTSGVVLCTYHDLALWRAMPDFYHSPSQRDREIQKARQASRPSGCQFCDFFSKAPGYMDRLSTITFTFDTHSSTCQPSQKRLWPVAVTSLSKRLCIEHLVRGGDPGLRVRNLSETRIEYEVLSECLDYCRRFHTNSCGQVEIKTMPGFKVIDCHTKHVIHASQTGCEYVALSYVWGDANTASGPLQSDPLTIEDAMTVTVALGFQYLWVDQYVRISNRHTGSGG